MFDREMDEDEAIDIDAKQERKHSRIQKYPIPELTPPAALMTGIIRGEREDQYDTTPRSNHGSFVLCWNYLARLPHKDSLRDNKNYDYTRQIDGLKTLHRRVLPQNQLGMRI